MSRSRTVSPKFFRNELLGELPHATRLLFVGLWTIADRSGRLEDRPRRIHIELFPYDLNLDVDQMLSELDGKDLIFRYSINGDDFIQIPKWFTYQHPHPREVDSEIPPIPCDLTDFKGCRTFSRLSKTFTRPGKTLDTPSPSVSSVPSEPSVSSGSSVPPVVPRAKAARGCASQQNGWKETAFTEFWAVVWAKIGKGKALRKYREKATTPELADRINRAAKEQAPRLLAEWAARKVRDPESGVLHPATWLNDDRWDDEVPQAQSLDFSPYPAWN